MVYGIINKSFLCFTMSHEIITNPDASKEQKYITLIPQVDSLISDETDLIANLANISAVLKETFNWWWVGFYIVRNRELVLGPFQGPLACTRIGFGKGVCGTSWQLKQTMIIDDVNTFDGHIACSAASQSEIVVPIMKNNEVIAILDVDSEHLNYFDSTDQDYLENLAQIIAELF